MARIPQEEIDCIKREVSLVRLVESSGITLKKKGKDYFGLCPYHDDQSPSLSITEDKNIWNCLGACQEGGDVIRWVEKMHGVSFTQAFHMLKEQSPALAASRSPVKQSSTPKLDNPLTANEDAALLNQIIDYYHAALKKSPEVQDYLKQRGLDNPELIDHFKLGFANRTLAYRLPETNRKAGKEIRGQLQRIGILRESGHEHFNGSLVIPVINNNQVLEVYGRKINHVLRKGTPYHLYLSGQHKGVFNVDALRASKEIILCESLIDALTFWNAGYRNVTTSYGINGFTDELLVAFKHHKTERILIAYDRDTAGDKAAIDLSIRLMKQGIDCYRIQFPKKMDANEYALQVQPAEKSLGVCIRSAVWMGKGEKPTAEETEALPPITAAREKPENPAIEAEINDNEINITLGSRSYRVRGLEKNTNLNQLKVNVLVTHEDVMYVDTVDLYAAKARQSFIKQSSLELCLKEDIIKKDIAKIFLKLESLQEETLNKAEEKTEGIELDAKEKQQAIDYLKHPDLLKNILIDFNNAGVVGEETNKLVGYLAAVSRKLDKPLAVMVQSSSAAGKSSLMDAVLAMMPEEEKCQYSAMTGQSLFYMGQTDLKNKILAIAEEEGASNASYALKLLQSEGEVSIASTGKDETTGELVTKEYRVEGPVMLFLTTTAIDIDEELMNRCLVLSVNETREQTKAIHQRQRQGRTLEGLTLKQQKKTLLCLHKNAQRLLKPLSIINPYADQLTFLDSQTRTRRDHEKYLTLIDTIALLHQYQRQTKTITVDNEVVEYIEVTLDDIETANRLAHEVLGRTLDELPPQTRKLLTKIKTLVSDECKKQKIKQSDYRFSRKIIRAFTGMGNTQLKIHCGRLEDMEYLLVHRGGRGLSMEYELLYNNDDSNNKAHLMGLIDVDTLKKHPYDKKKSGVKAEKSGSSRPQVGGVSGQKKTRKVNGDKVYSESGSEKPKSTISMKKQTIASYPQNTAVV
ncbi:DNA primase, phage associated [hydrothermal vent metagenome]|uniref:DNA primase, phage associated n=1 Tax=hydrothermal vent metagenome TaxID=652676 RepID=A0A3B0WY34_9ZZZZ